MYGVFGVVIEDFGGYSLGVLGVVFFVEVVGFW